MKRLLPLPHSLIAFTFTSLALAACGGPASPPPAAPASAAGTAAAKVDPKAIVASPDRADQDRALDKGRHPEEFLTFFNLQPGQRVADLMAGGGYTSELMARAVAPNGVVYAQNNAFVQKFANEPLTARLKTPGAKGIVRVDRELEDPLPPEAKDLDLVVMVYFYHDTYWQKTDREKMNRAVMNALKPGGIYGVLDHSAREGVGIQEVDKTHRIEESVVKDELTKAGFVFVEEGNFLRNPKDTRDWSASPREAGERRGTSDRFVLKFKKP